MALEVARALVADPTARLAAPAIFLLNGAEETFCQGAAGFTQNSSWRDAPGAFINLESTGSGGPAVLFQATGVPAVLDCALQKQRILLRLLSVPSDGGDGQL